MIYSFGAILFLLLLYGPFIWVKFIMWKYSSTITGIPGTGGQLAQHLVSKLDLADVTVEVGSKDNDHYDPTSKRISLSPNIFDGKSITAIAVAAHEVGHAIQFTRNEPVSQLRGKYLGSALLIKKFGTGIMLSIPVVTIIFKVPHVIVITAAIGVITMLASALMYVAILPEEYDASFNKALPILKSGYVPNQHIPAVRKVLRAAALTYFAGALTDIVNLWRWLRVFR